MNTLAKKIKNQATAIKLEFTDQFIHLFLEDGRQIKTPLEFYPRLSQATKIQLQDYRLLGSGTGIHWKSLNEDLSVDSIIEGRKGISNNISAKKTERN